MSDKTRDDERRKQEGDARQNISRIFDLEREDGIGEKKDDAAGGDHRESGERHEAVAQQRQHHDDDQIYERDGAGVEANGEAYRGGRAQSCRADERMSQKGSRPGKISAPNAS